MLRATPRAADNAACTGTPRSHRRRRDLTPHIGPRATTTPGPHHPRAPGPASPADGTPRGRHGLLAAERRPRPGTAPRPDPAAPAHAATPRGPAAWPRRGLRTDRTRSTAPPTAERPGPRPASDSLTRPPRSPTGDGVGSPPPGPAPRRTCGRHPARRQRRPPRNVPARPIRKRAPSIAAGRRCPRHGDTVRTWVVPAADGGDIGGCRTKRVRAMGTPSGRASSRPRTVVTSVAGTETLAVDRCRTKVSAPWGHRPDVRRPGRGRW